MTEKQAAADALALAFDRWERLSYRAETKPGSASLEELDRGWWAVLTALERWRLAQ